MQNSMQNTIKLRNFLIALWGLAACAFLASFLLHGADAEPMTNPSAPPGKLVWVVLIPAIVPLLIQGIRFVVPKVPKWLLPILCPVLGAGMDIILYYAGAAAPGTTNGLILGALGNFVREVVDQLRKALSSATT